MDTCSKFSGKVVSSWITSKIFIYEMVVLVEHSNRYGTVSR